MSTTPYLDAVLSSLPPDAQEASRSALSTALVQPVVELLVRLAADAPEGHSVISIPSLANPTLDGYTSMRNAAQAELRRLHNKRKRSVTPPEDTAKRVRLGAAALPSTPSPPDVDDTPVYTLHALSVSSPVRKKLDITVHTKSLRLGDLSLPLSSLKRAFLLPTRGKAKPHWTVALLSSDTPARPTKGSTQPSSAEFQVVFGVDAEPATTINTTSHPAPAQSHAKGTPTRPHLLEFLRHLPITFSEPSADIFSPAASGGSLGLAAYLGAKEGTLWFLKDGVLGEHKPVQFWPLADLDIPDGDFDAVRLQSATGRTCSVFVRRRRTGEGDGEEGEETEFAMVDGREQEGIRAWVRRYRGRFGKGTAPVENGSSAGPSKGKAVETAPAAKVTSGSMEVDEGDSDSDSNFEVSSEEYDGGSPTSSSDEDEDGDGEIASGDQNLTDEESGDGDEVGQSGEEDGDDDDDGPLDPAQHPLMRPGAVPRMSRAAMDMAAGIVLGDLLNRPTTDDEGEEDELMD